MARAEGLDQGLLQLHEFEGAASRWGCQAMSEDMAKGGQQSFATVALTSDVWLVAANAILDSSVAAWMLGEIHSYPTTWLGYANLEDSVEPTQLLMRDPGVVTLKRSLELKVPADNVCLTSTIEMTWREGEKRGERLPLMLFVSQTGLSRDAAEQEVVLRTGMPIFISVLYSDVERELQESAAQTFAAFTHAKEGALIKMAADFARRLQQSVGSR